MDKATIENWYVKYGPMVLRRCRQLLGDEASAYDAMQEVFVQVLRKKELIADAFPSSFLYRVATNTALNMIRSRRRRNEDSSSHSLIELIAGEDDPSEVYATRSILQRIFKKEPSSTRTMAVFHFVDGLTLDETAKELDMSVSGVRKRLRQLKERLQSGGMISDGGKHTGMAVK